MDLGLAGRACVVTGASRGHRPRDGAASSAPRAPTCCWSPATRSGSRRLQEEADGAAPRPAGAPPTLALDVTAEDAGERMLAAADRALRRPRRARQQRRRRQLARPRRRPRRGLARPVRAERDGAAAGDARRGPGDGRARLGPRRQRLLDRRQASLGGDAGVLGREGGRALALAPLRRPLREAAASSSTRSAPARSNRRCGWSPAACSTSHASCRAPRAARRRSRPPAPKRPIGRLAEVGEIAAAIVFLCSERASYVAAPPGRSTAAPSR